MNTDLAGWAGIPGPGLGANRHLPGSPALVQQVVEQAEPPAPAWMGSRVAVPWQGWERARRSSCLSAQVPGEEAAHRGRQTLPFTFLVSQSTHIFHVQQTVNSPSY